MMTMNLNLPGVTTLILALAAGMALGAFYFTALWRTVRRLSDTSSPLRLLVGSFIFRAAIVLTGFYFVMDGHWERLAAALIGFVLMRKILERRFGQEHTVRTGDVPG
ncbi:MAG: ATP synthase subunit I [Smithellaceae bacterium]